MLRRALLYRQKRFHEEYQQRLASANSREEAMTRDLADFDEGIELLLQGQSYEACRKMMPRFLTVYRWILQRNLPLSFREYTTTTRFKKVDPHLLENSPSFAYFVGVCQAKTKNIPSETLAIRKSDSSFEEEVEKCFNSLHVGPRKERTNGDGYRPSQRVYYCSSGLMSYISEITENNSRVPHSFFIPELIIPHLSGFSDARAVPTYSRAKFQCSDIVRQYPIILVTKKGNIPLMSAVNSALNFLGIASAYDPQKNSSRIYVTKLKSIKKFIDLGLFRSREKMDRLKELYNYWQETNEFDRHGAYQKLKEKIRLERMNGLEKDVGEESVDDED